MTLPGTHACDVFTTQGVARVARMVRRSERDKHVTDRGKRAELRRAETEEVELLTGVGFVPVWRQVERDREDIHLCLPDAVRVGGRTRALDKESHVPCDAQDQNEILNLQQCLKKKDTRQTLFGPSIMFSGDDFQTTT